MPRRRRKIVIAMIPFGLRQLRNGWGGQMNRILCQMGIGDMTLYPRMVRLPEREPRLPFLIVSPNVSEQVGSPTMQ